MPHQQTKFSELPVLINVLVVYNISQEYPEYKQLVCQKRLSALNNGSTQNQAKLAQTSIWLSISGQSKFDNKHGQRSASLNRHCYLVSRNDPSVPENK